MRQLRAWHMVAMTSIVIIAGATLLVLFSLRSDEPATKWPDESARGRPEPTAPVTNRAPLTGLVVDDLSDLDHPAVAVKVSDVRQAHPHLGVDRADIVFVEPIGVSYTRIAAVFHSDLPDSVGPVRSVRPADAPLLGPLSPVFGNTMAAGWVIDYTDGVADWDNLGTLRVSGSRAYTVDSARPRPDHVFAHPQELLRLSDFTTPPTPYFTYATDAKSSSAATSRRPAGSAVIPYGSNWRVTWTYDEASRRYHRDEPWGPHMMTDGTQIAAANVLVIQVESTMDKLVKGHGAPVPVLQLVDGSGRFTALAGGSSVTGTWSKGDVNEPFQLRTDAGDKLTLSPGNTWVELPATDAAITVRPNR